MRVITQVPYEKRGVTHRKTLHMRMRLTYTKMRQTHNNYITPHLPFPQYMKIVRTTTISIKYQKYIIICSKRQRSTEVFKNILKKVQSFRVVLKSSRRTDFAARSCVVWSNRSILNLTICCL